MTHRYFVEMPITGEHATLVDAEAHHFAHVMRGKAGDELVVFDGTGYEFSARAERVDRSRIQLAVLAKSTIDRELRCPLVIGASLPKGDRQRWLIEKLVELGVQRFVPLVTARGVAQPTAGALARLGRAVIEASKQCGRNRLMMIDEPLPWESLIDQSPRGAVRLVAHPNAAQSAGAVLQGLTSKALEEGFVAAVGPEGGLTDEEVVAATAAGWIAIDLGPRILRVETAAVAIATVGMLAIMRDD